MIKIFFNGLGVMYSTLFTMPYLLVAHYHAQGVVSLMKPTKSTRKYFRFLISF